MKTKLSLITILITVTPTLADGVLSEAIEGITHKGELRLGAVRTKDSDNNPSTTLSLGGRVSLSTKPIYGINLATTLFTSNPLFGKDDEGMFLNSKNRGYSIVGESYLEANLGKTNIKAGRQIIETPYADSDDIGMIPNSFEGYSLINQDMKNSTIILAWLNKWSGIDTDRPEKFRKIQPSGDAILTAGLIYKEDQTTLQAWHYELEDINLNYFELGYEADTFSMGLQYTDQENSNSAYGISLGGTMDGLELSFAYNKTDGILSNGFGAGPFFTSAENHTVAEIEDQEAKLYGAKYTKGQITLGATHVDLDKGEDETDYLASFAINKNHTLDVIYSDMYDDGNMVRFFANYKF